MELMVERGDDLSAFGITLSQNRSAMMWLAKALDRPGVVNLRWLLYAARKPPTVAYELIE
jgi:hypothetical protein